MEVHCNSFTLSSWCDTSTLQTNTHSRWRVEVFLLKPNTFRSLWIEQHRNYTNNRKRHKKHGKKQRNDNGQIHAQLSICKLNWKQLFFCKQSTHQIETFPSRFIAQYGFRETHSWATFSCFCSSFSSALFLSLCSFLVPLFTCFWLRANLIIYQMIKKDDVLNLRFIRAQKSNFTDKIKFHPILLSLFPSDSLHTEFNLLKIRK